MTDKLNGNDAVNLAAEQSKSTSGRNLVGLPDLPVEQDTANLRQGPNIHDGLLALLPLVGVWRGNGQASDGNGDYEVGQQLIIAHDGENYLSYESRVWRTDSEGVATGQDSRETGFWRISEKDEIELVIAGSGGYVEIMYGEPMTERAWQLESASTMVTSTGPEDLGPGKRLYGLMPNNDLGWVDERLVDGEMVPRISVQLSRWAG